MSYSEGVHRTAKTPNDLWIQGENLRNLFLFVRATILCRYKVWPYAGQSQLDVKFENSSNLKIFWPASEPCIGETITYISSIFPVLILRTHTYRPCNWKGISMRSLATVICQIWMKYRWNMEIAGNVLFWRVSIKRLELQTTYRYRAETLRIYSYRWGQPPSVYTRSHLMRVSHNWTSNLNIP